MGKWIFKGDQDWNKWFAKWGKGLVTVVAASGITYTATFITANPLPVDPKYVFLVGLFVTLLSQLGNWLQHA